MALLVRKIERAKWNRRKSNAIEDTPADAITSCMRTSSDRLSVWQIDTEERLPQAVLAIAAAGSSLDTMDFVVFAAAELEFRGLIVRRTPSGTGVHNMHDAHYDIVELTYSSLGRVAGLVLDAIGRDAVKRFRMNELRELLRSAITNGQLDESSLTQSLREKLFPEQRPSFGG
jgi:hypothetical protein